MQLQVAHQVRYRSACGLPTLSYTPRVKGARLLSPELGTGTGCLFVGRDHVQRRPSELCMQTYCGGSTGKRGCLRLLDRRRCRIKRANALEPSWQGWIFGPARRSPGTEICSFFVGSAACRSSSDRFAHCSQDCARMRSAARHAPKLLQCYPRTCVYQSASPKHSKVLK